MVGMAAMVATIARVTGAVNVKVEVEVEVEVGEAATTKGVKRMAVRFAMVRMHRLHADAAAAVAAGVLSDETAAGSCREHRLLPPCRKPPPLQLKSF